MQNAQGGLRVFITNMANYNPSNMLTKEEILTLADNRLDFSNYTPEYIQQLNELVKGDYAKVQEEQYHNIEKGVDMFLQVGVTVELLYEGKAQITKVKKVGYNPQTEYFEIICENNSVFRFRVFGFSSFGATGAYYGIVNDPDKKTGIRYINFKNE